MIRFDQRNFDVQGTERVFKKVVHPGQNIRLVDKDGIPLRLPNTTTLSRLHSTYVLSPRGVPARKSNHSYSGQLAQAKMQSLVNSLETTPPQEMVSYTSMHNVGNGLSSAGSSRHYIPANLTPKKRTFGSGPPRSVKSMPTKSASTQRSRYLTSAPATEQMSQITDPDSEKSNDSPQGKRLEKEWSALSQCRALKRSSEIVSHRVDRMYFMTGNKLKLQSKYLIEDDELKHLQELSQARASSRASRSSHSRKGDIYRPSQSSQNEKTMDSLVSNRDEAKSGQMNGMSEGDGTVPVSNGKENGHKKNTDPKVIVSQKVLTPKPPSRKSPIQGWSGEENSEKAPSVVENNTVLNNSLHEGKANNAGEEIMADDNAIQTSNNDNTVETVNNKTVNNQDSTNRNDDEEEEKIVNVKTENPTFMTEGKLENGVDDQEKADKESEKSVHNVDERSVISDKDKTEVKSEDYIEKVEENEIGQLEEN